MPHYQQIAEHIGTTQGQCVLLLGPELSVDKAGKYYKSYYKELTANNPSSIIQYFEGENIFLFKDQAGLDAMIEPIKRFYADIGDETLLEAIAQIKFPLIINVCPDKSLNKIFEKVYNYTEGVDYVYNYRDNNEYGTEEERKASLASIPTPTKAIPVIYNMFGDWENNNSLVYNHKSFYDTVQDLLGKDAIPGKIQTFLNKANSYLFLGFDFDSWHYHLMCHKLGLGVGALKKSYGSQYHTGNTNRVQVIMKDYFKVNFVDDNPTHTIQEIIKSLEEKYPQSLRQKVTNQHYGVYISYAWADKGADILELLSSIIMKNNINPAEKSEHIKSLINKSGKIIADNTDLNWLLEGKKSEKDETIEEWYDNLPSVNKTKNENEIYNREYIVSQIEKRLKDRDIKVFRDRNEITYGDSIDSFMNRIGKGKAVIKIVSDKYLRSRYCMDEAMRIHQYTNNDSRIFTVVLNDSNSLNSFEEQLGDMHNIEYKQYWEAMIENIYSKIDVEIKNPIDRERIKRYYSIYIDIYDFIIGFIKRIQDEVRLGLSENVQSSLPISPLETLTAEEEQKLNNFIDVVEKKLKQD